MSRSDNEKKWIELGLNDIKEVDILSINDLIIEMGNSKTGFVAALFDVYKGNRSKTSGPIQVTWIHKEDKFLVTDGLHRLVEKVFSKSDKTKILCEIDWSGFSLRWVTPDKNNRLL